MTINPPPLAMTIAISKVWRRAYIMTAIEYRKAGRREDKKKAMLAAMLEKMNSRELLGPAPF